MSTPPPLPPPPVPPPLLPPLPPPPAPIYVGQSEQISVQQGDPRRRSWKSGVILGVSILILLATASTAVFPFVARAYAQNAVSMTSPEPGDPEPGEETVEPVTKTDDLGIRTFPLLTDEARHAWETDPDAALDQAGQAVFGAQWSNILEITMNGTEWADSLFEMVKPGSDWGYSGGIISEGLSGLKQEDESHIVDLVGLILLKAVDTHQDRHTGLGYSGYASPMATMAFALADIASQKFVTCDVLMTRAYSFGLDAFPPSKDYYYDEGDKGDVYLVDPWWSAATSVCGDDPTPRIEEVKSHFASGYFAAVLHPHGMLDARLSAAKAVVEDFPDIAASHLLLADVCRALADVFPADNVGPFTVKEMQSLAIQEYTKAAELSNEPALLVALADARARTGDLDGAADSLSSLGSQDSSRKALETESLILGLNHNYSGAADTLAQAMRTPAPQQVTTLQRTSRELTTPVSSVSTYFTVFGGPIGGAGGSVDNFGFVPTSRGEYTWFLRGGGMIPKWEQNPRTTDNNVILMLLLAQRFTDAQTLCSTSADRWGIPQNWCTIAARSGMQMNEYANDAYQDMWRGWGDLEGALTTVYAWIDADPSNAVAHERAGEILFLLERWEESADESKKAVDLNISQKGRPLNDGPPEMTGPGWARLRQSAALRQTGQADEALTLLADTEALQSQYCSQYKYGCPMQSELELLSMYSNQEAGQIYYENKDYAQALDRASESLSWLDQVGGNDGDYVVKSRGAQEHLAGLSCFALGRYEEALDWANQALAFDPYSPLYQEAVADAQRALAAGASSNTPSETPSPTDSPSGTPTETPTEPTTRANLMETYRAALELDPTLFSSWNNMGVLLAQDGQTEEAITAFKQAVATVPDYPYAWFNLGVVEAGKPGLLSFLFSQGALGKAGALDSTWKNKDVQLTFDDEVYQSGLDVSKPIPAEWHLSQTVRSNPTLLTVGLIAMIGLRLVRDIGKDWFSGRWAEGALRTWGSRGDRFGILISARPAAIITTVISLGALLWLTGPNGWRELVMVTLIGVALLGWHALMPRYADRPAPAKHASWLPASVATLILAPFGLGFTPPAPLTSGEVSVKASRAGLIGVAAVTCVLAATAIATSVPVARSGAIAGLLIVSSALVPIFPLDGARLGFGRWVSLGITVALIAGTVATALGWL